MPPVSSTSATRTGEPRRPASAATTPRMRAEAPIGRARASTISTAPSVGDGLDVGVADGAGGADAGGEADGGPGVGQTSGVQVGFGDALGSGVPLGAAVDVGVEDGDGVWTGDGGAARFCGDGVAWMSRSSVLSFVSVVFPDGPPGRRSRLDPAAGAGAGVPSTNAFVASPQPIASIGEPPVTRNATAPPVEAKPPE